MLGLTLALAAYGSTAAGAMAGDAAKPQRIMSLMLCNDLLLLQLAPRERIASISFLARDAVADLMPGADVGVAVNQGTAEDILLQQPDLILAGTYSSTRARHLAREAGARVLEVEAANNFEDIRRNVQQVAAAVGEPARGEALLASMDKHLAWLAAHPPARPPRVVAWSGGGQTPGTGTLTHAILTASGAVNVAARNEDGRYGSFGLEELLAARPDAILQGENRWAGPSLQDAESAHPLIARNWQGRRISYPDAAYACGLPQSADAAVALRRLYDRLPAAALPW